MVESRKVLSDQLAEARSAFIARGRMRTVHVKKTCARNVAPPWYDVGDRASLHWQIAEVPASEG